MNQLFLKFSGLRQDNPFSDSFGKTSLAVIQELEPEQIVQMPLQELIDFLTDRSNNRFENPEETAKELQKVARNSFRLDKVMKDPVNLSLSVTLSVIQHMESEVKKLDKAIAKLMKAIPNTLESVQGIVRFMPPAFSLKLAILSDLITTVHSPSTRDSYGTSINLANTKLTKRRACELATNICDIT